jgi:enoyl-CoA hydratase/carnithine racemase
VIEIHEHGEIREIRLARPPANALDGTMLRTLIAVLTRACDEGRRAVVISGLPGMFSGGLDVPALMGLDRAQMMDFWDAFFGVQRRLASLPIPVAAAITGHSPAGGAVLAAYCDYRVMADGKYRIGVNEVQVGLFAGPIIFGVIRRLVGPRQAERLLAGGLLMSPPEALAVGLIDRLLPDAEVIPAAIEWARSMTSLPPKAMSAMRALARTDLGALVGNLGPKDYEAMNDAWFSEETQVTMRKLVERLKKK